MFVCTLAYANRHLSGIIQSVLFNKVYEIPIFPRYQQISRLRAVPNALVYLKISPISRLTVLTLKEVGTRPTVVLLHITKQAITCSLGDQPLKGTSTKRKLLRFPFPLDA